MPVEIISSSLKALILSEFKDLAEKLRLDLNLDVSEPTTGPDGDGSLDNVTVSVTISRIIDDIPRRPEVVAFYRNLDKHGLPKDCLFGLVRMNLGGGVRSYQIMGYDPRATAYSVILLDLKSKERHKTTPEALRQGLYP